VCGRGCAAAGLGACGARPVVVAAGVVVGAASPAVGAVNRVAVRIVRRGPLYVVVGRKTQVVCRTFDEAWEASVPYFAGRVR
jgi:hypothetical protein